MAEPAVPSVRLGRWQWRERYRWGGPRGRIRRAQRRRERSGCSGQGCTGQTRHTLFL